MTTSGRARRILKSWLCPEFAIESYAIHAGVTRSVPPYRFLSRIRFSVMECRMLTAMNQHTSIHHDSMSVPIIIHIHIFKNAGSSIFATFRRNFGNRAVELEPDNEDLYLTPEEIEDYLKDHPDTVMVSSHRIRLPLPPTLAGRQVIPLVFIRDPLDRLASVYRFERSPRREGALSALARATDLVGFMEILLRSGLQGLLSNVQTQFCCGSSTTKPE